MGAVGHEELLGRIDGVLRHLLHASHLLAPGDLNQAVVDELIGAGFTEANMWLADLEQRTLVALPPAEDIGLPIDTSVAGRAYQQDSAVVVDAGPSQQRLWLP